MAKITLPGRKLGNFPLISINPKGIIQQPVLYGFSREDRKYLRDYIYGSESFENMVSSLRNSLRGPQRKTLQVAGQTEKLCLIVTCEAIFLPNCNKGWVVVKQARIIISARTLVTLSSMSIIKYGDRIMGSLRRKRKVPNAWMPCPKQLCLAGVSLLLKP